MQALVASLVLLGLTYWLKDRFGHRYAGLFAGLPLTTLIAVLSTAARLDSSALQSVLDGCMIAIAAAAMSIRLYASLHRFSALISLLSASVFFLLLVGVLLRISSLSPLGSIVLGALSLGAIVITASFGVNPTTSTAARVTNLSVNRYQSRWIQRGVGVALVLISFACSHFAPAVIAGMVASAPILGWSAMASAHQLSAPGENMKAVAHGYNEGLLIKWSFIAPIAAGIVAQQTVTVSLLLGCFGAIALIFFIMAVHRYQHLSSLKRG